MCATLRTSLFSSQSIHTGNNNVACAFVLRMRDQTILRAFPSPAANRCAELAGCTSLNQRADAKPSTLGAYAHPKENSMNRKIVIAAMAALTVATISAPASAQRYRSWNSWGGPGFGVSVGFGDYGWNGGYYDYGYSPGWGYDDWGYGSSYAAAPGYGCTCANRYRTARVAPGVRYSSYAWGGYPSDYDYDSYYYSSSPGYASVGFGWSSDDRRFDRSRRVDRVRVRDRDFSGDFRETRGTGNTRVRFSERTGGETRVRAGVSGEVRGGVSGEARGTRTRANGSGGVNVRASGGERRGGDNAQ
jgi:hypothetical protein